MGLFSRKKNKKGSEVDDAFSNVYKKISAIDSWEDPKKLQHYILDSCEQIVATTKEIQKQDAESKVIKSYLNDIKIIESLEADKANDLKTAASRVVEITKSLEVQKYTVRNITNEQYVIISEEEDEMQGVIKRMEDSELKMTEIHRQIREIEGEKSRYEIEKDSLAEQSLLIKRLAYVVLVSFVAFFILLLMLGNKTGNDFSFGMLLLFFITTLLGFLMFMRQGTIKKLRRKCNIRLNTVVQALNMVRMKYVNIKNGVDYTKEKYKVDSSKELLFVWEQYIEKVKDNERFIKSHQDLEDYTERFHKILDSLDLHDKNFWKNRPEAIVNEKDMAEVKHKLVARHRRIRERMDENRRMVQNERDEIDRMMKQHEFYLPEINEIIKGVDKMCGTGPRTSANR